MPNQIYMGQKDFQQAAIIQNMLLQTGRNTELVRCPIIREADGLAMSSRNVRLQPAIRNRANLIHQSLEWAKASIDQLEPAEISRLAMEKLSIPDFRPEYFEVVDGTTLQKIDPQNPSAFVVACAAVWAGEVRLIDNMILKSPK